MPLNIPAPFLLLVVLLVVLVVVLVVMRLRRSPRTGMVTIRWNGRNLRVPVSIRNRLLEYYTPPQRRLIARVDRARLSGQPVTPADERAYDAYMASAIRELIFDEPALVEWFIDR